MSVFDPPHRSFPLKIEQLSLAKRKIEIQDLVPILSGLQSDQAIEVERSLLVLWVYLAIEAGHFFTRQGKAFRKLPQIGQQPDAKTPRKSEIGWLTHVLTERGRKAQHEFFVPPLTTVRVVTP